MNDEFKNLETTRKGDIAENIVFNYLSKNDWIIYQAPEKAHIIDAIAFNKKLNVMIGVEIKCKPKLKYYPATGFDQNDFEVYQDLQNKYNFPVYIFFADEEQGKIYGNTLKKLSKNIYKKVKIDKLILFNMDAMVDVCSISDEQINKIKNLTNSNY